MESLQNSLSGLDERGQRDLQEYPSVFAVVLNWNSYEDTVECIESLGRTTYPRLNIVLVDNGSTDGSGDKLSLFFSQLHVIRLSSNKGYSAGNNEGIRFAVGRGAQYVLIINNDTIVEPGFLEPMVKVAQSSADVGMVTCKAFFESDRQRTYGTGGYFSKVRCGGIPLPRRKQDQECEVNFISGCILLVKKRVFEQSGFLNERFFMYCEDMEFSFRVQECFKLMYTPRGVIYHKSGAGNRWWNYSEAYLFYNTRNKFLLFREFPLWYRAYVCIYLFANSVAKTAAILLGALGRGDFTGAISKVRFLWKGFWRGLEGSEFSLEDELWHRKK